MSDQLRERYRCQALEALSPAQRRLLPGLIDDCLQGLAALVAIDREQGPDPEEVKKSNAAREQLTERAKRWVAARRKLEASVLALEHLLGKVGAPPGLRTIQELGHDPHCCGLWEEPGAEDAWRKAIQNVEREARAELEAIRRSAGGPRRGNPNPRDKYCYERRRKGDSLKAIMTAVNRREGWEPLATVQGVHNAIKRYAEQRGLEFPRR
jgi:hypothetical protein